MDKQLKFRLLSVISILSMLVSAVGMPLGGAQAAGNTYYVDNTVPCSDGGTGSLENPLCTIARGEFLASAAGDTVHVLHGSYAETIFPTHSGVEGNPITFHADPDVTVTGDSAGFGSAFGVTGQSYVVIDGFNITNTRYKGIFVDSSNHITISHNHVTYAGANTAPDTHQQGIFLRNTTYSTITENITDHNSCIGIRLINNSNYNTVSNNISFGNSSAIAYPVVVVSDAAGIEVTGSSHNTVINNTTYGNEDSGINIYLSSTTGGSSYNFVIGNLSYGNGDHGIDHNNSPYNTVVGNTVHGNGTTGINFEGETASGSHHATVANNISVGNGLTPPEGSFGGNLRVDSASIAGTTLDYNIFDRQGAAIQIVWDDTSYVSLAAFRAAAPSQEVHGVEGDPLFVAPVASVLRSSAAYPGSETTGNYYINPGSPAIDSANSDAPGESLSDIDGNTRVDDPATADSGAGTRTYDDRGAYEFLPTGASLPIVTTQAVTDITGSTATGNGTVTATGEPNPTQHGVVWSTSPNPTTADNKTEDGPVSGTGPFTSSITGLAPGALYHVRAYATNAMGTVYGEDVTFTTLLTPVVTTQAVTNIAETSATGNGNVTALGIPNPTQHGVVWSTSPNPTIADNKTEDGPVSGTGPFTSAITGLTPGTPYYVRAYATNGAGTAYGEDVTFTSLLAPTVTTQPVTDITIATATGNGFVNALGVPNPTQHGVVWSTSPNPTTADSKTMDGPVGATGAFTSAITGLTQGTLYHVRAYATNAAGTVYGEDVTFTTLLGATVTTQAVTDITTTTATGNGDITALGTFNPTQHGVVWSTSLNPTTADNKTEDGPVSETGTFTSAITGLTPGTLYHVRAYATSIAGTSYGEDVTFTAHELPTVTTQAVTSIGPTTAIGNGNITDLGVPNPTQHGVVWSTSLNPTLADNKTMDGSISATGAFTSSLTGLTPGMLYHVRAYATNEAGTAYGEDVTFTTLPSSTGTTTPNTNAGTGSNVTGTGTVDWANPGYITADDTLYASATLNNATSRYLQGTNYGFAIPSNATIDGIVVTIGRYESGSGTGTDVRDSIVSLIKGGTVTGSNKAATTTEWPTGSPVAAIYGTTSDLWGATWTPADINASDFGVALSANSVANRIAYVDYMQISVTYTVTVYGSTTSVNCGAGTPVVTYGLDITCVATVARGSGAKTPTGNVSWTTSGSGSFVTSPCALSGSGGTATCSVTYTPISVGSGSHQIMAAYAGDENFYSSNGNQTLIVNKKTASVTPNAASKVYGDPDPILTGTLDGFLPADGVSAAYSREEGETIEGSPYTISAVLSPAGALVNYEITYNTADFTITQPPEEYSLTIDIVGNGTVTPTPNNPHYHAGDIVHLDAIAGEGWAFESWSANVVDGNVTITGNTIVTATFVLMSLPAVTTQEVTGITDITATGNGNVTDLGVPNPTQHGVVWSRFANPTTSDNKTTDGPVSATGAFTSSITGLIPDTLYHVRAYATNAAGTVYGEDVIFTTLIVPTVITQPVTDIAITTATGNGNVTDLGLPNPTQHGVVWSTAPDPTLADNKTEDGPIGATGAFTSAITGLTSNTLYHIRAYATNAAGTSYGEDVTFTTLPLAPTVTTQAVTNVATTTATGNGNVTDLGVPNPTEHGVVWSTSANPTIADDKTEDGPVSATGAFTSSITGLTSGTLYHVRAYATNAAGTAYGEDVTFTTFIAPGVTTREATAITATTATGNGDITELGVPNPTEHGVVWSTSLNPTIADNKTTDGPVSATGPFVSSITGLTPGTLYHIRAYATNAGATAYGEDVTFTTLLAPTVTTQAVTGITTTTATGNGDITVLGVPNPTQHGVVWSTLLNPTLADNKTEDGPVSATGAFTSAITGLTPGTLYHVRAYATNVTGTVYGDDVTFTALLAPVVTTQAVTSIGTTTATGNGNVTALGVPNPTQHGMVWSTALNPTLADSKTEDGPVSAVGAFTSSITGLTPGMLYHVRAYVSNAAGTVYGEDVTFTALQVPTVTTQAATNVTQTSAIGNGNITSLGVPNPTEHGVVWATTANPTTANNKVNNGPAGATGAYVSAIGGLAPNTTYHVRAYAINAAGTVYGTDVQFTTSAGSAVTFTTSGSWTAPAGVTSVIVEVWGGGGKGGTRSSGMYTGGGGGGGGAYSLKTNIPVTPGQGYSYVVGAGATGTSAGGDSYFINASTVLAKGGNSVPNNEDNGSSGGAAGSGVGDTKYSGGNGANAGSDGGGGGSSAGTGANGNNGSGATGGSAPAGGGAGGNGATSSGNGSPGLAPGGGGGGAYREWSGTRNGGNGANGQVRITYFTANKTTTTSVNCGSGTPSVTFGSSITCVATVTASSGTASPTGTVSWNTNGAGSFVTSPCTLAGTGGSASCSVTYTPSAVGTGLHIVTANYAGAGTFLPSSGGQTVTVEKASATVTLGSLAQTYDGTAKSATATTVPDGLAVNFTYNGSATAPTNAGSYAVVGTINDASYQGSASDTLIIDKAASTTTVTGGTFTYTGSAHPATVAVTGAGGLSLSPTPSYSGGCVDAPVNISETTPTACTASFTYAGDANHYGSSGSDTIVITKAEATIVVNGYSGAYDGAAHGASGTATGVLSESLSGLDLGVSFTNVPGGTAHWTFTDVTGNYNDASGDATIVISKADATIVVNGYSGAYDGAAHGASGTATGVLSESLSGLDLGASFTNIPGGTAHWTFTDVTGNYNDASGDADILITPASATVALSNLVQVYDGTPKSVTVTTTPAGLSVSVTYDGSPTPPSAVGSYAVIASVTDPNYSGSANGILVIQAKHSLALVPGWNLVSFNVHPADTSIEGVLADIAGHYDLVYAWDASGAHSSSGHWMMYDPALPPFLNTLTALDETLGFWIHMTATDTLDVVGSAPTSTSIQLLDNAGGWNLVSYPALANRALPEVLELHGVGTDYSLVFAYHANDGADPWKLFDTELPPFLNDLTELTPGWGYWIKVNADHSWDVQFLPD